MTAQFTNTRSAVTLVLAITFAGLLISGSLVRVTVGGKAAPPWPLSVAVVGSTFAAGELNRVVWPTLLAQRTGWSVSNVALPSAGFAADGRGGHAFTYQVERAQAAHPQIIVISTGEADNGLPDMGPVRMGVIDTVNKIKLGGQRALVLGPTWYATPVPAKVKTVSAAVQKAAQQLEVPFLDAIDPPWLTIELMQPDLDAPTDAGQSIIADKVAAWLRAEVT